MAATFPPIMCSLSKSKAEDILEQTSQAALCFSCVNKEESAKDPYNQIVVSNVSVLSHELIVVKA